MSSPKFNLTGTIEDPQGIRATKSGFLQIVIVKVPHESDQKYDQYYTVNIWSNSQTDSRFRQPSDKGKPCKCIAYLKGDRWLRSDGRGFQYNNKIQLSEWI